MPNKIKIRNKFSDVKGLDVELGSLAKQIQDLWDGVEITIGNKSATIGTVGTTPLYLRTFTKNGVAISVVTSD